jgi:hypothetical protein
MDIDNIKLTIKNLSNELIDNIHKLVYSQKGHELDVREYGSVTIVEGLEPEDAMTANWFYAGQSNVRVRYSNNDNGDDMDLKYLPIEKLIEIYEFLKNIL